ncbi:hypothetical protein ACFU6I_22520 [Streptomyces sp. NPDC057486]|uniref:hypothetical protein n=1 Tax=Streptomyces sp. NPDC057486 TaxID=3346145 RepID=UPI0036C50F42
MSQAAPGSIVVRTLGALIDIRAHRTAAPPVGLLTALEATRAADCEVLTSSAGGSPTE